MNAPSSQVLRLWCALLLVVVTAASVQGQAINNAGEVELTDNQFDKLVFAGGDGSTQRQLMDEKLKRDLEYVTSTYSLSGMEKSRLELAGRGDILKFFGRVEEARRKFAPAPLTRDEYRNLLLECRSIRNYGPDISLFNKTLRHLLTNKQAKTVDK